MARFHPDTGERLDPETLANDWPEHAVAEFAYVAIPSDADVTTESRIEVPPDAQIIGAWDTRAQPEPTEPTPAPENNTTATAATKPARSTRRGKKKGR